MKSTNMIELNYNIEAAIRTAELDDDCHSIDLAIRPICQSIEEYIKSKAFSHAVSLYLLLLKSIAKHFVEDEHYYYFDDMYLPDYTLQHTCEQFIKAHGSGVMPEDDYNCLKEGIKEISKMEAYDDYASLYVCSMRL